MKCVDCKKVFQIGDIGMCKSEGFMCQNCVMNFAVVILDGAKKNEKEK